jgi:hypothetical protein
MGSFSESAHGEKWPGPGRKGLIAARSALEWASATRALARSLPKFLLPSRSRPDHSGRKLCCRSSRLASGEQLAARSFASVGTFFWGWQARRPLPAKPRFVLLLPGASALTYFLVA